MDSKVKEILLLGTERRSLDLSIFPEAVQKKVRLDQNESQKLLEAMTYSTYYYTNGQALPILEGNTIKEILLEDRELMLYEHSRVLEEIFGLAHFIKSKLLKHWLDALAASNKIVHPQFILQLLKEGQELTKPYKAIILNLVGKKGQYIAPMIKSVDYKLSIENSDWAEGNSAMRKAHFLNLRLTEPSAAIKNLRDTWHTESIKDKLHFLKIIQETLVNDDLEFINEVFEKYKYSTSEKKTEKDCRYLLTGMLCALGYEPILEKLKVDLSPYVSKKKKGLISSIVGNNETEILITLPMKNDAFWNGENLNEMMAFEEKNINLQLYDYDSYFWFASFLEILPFSFWTSMLACTEEDFIKYLFKNYITKIKGEEEYIFLTAIKNNPYIRYSQDIILALIPFTKWHEIENLIPEMSQAVFEKYIMQNKEMANFDLLASRKDDKIWSVVFTKNILSEVFKNLKGGSNLTERQGSIIATYANSESYDYIRSTSLAFANEYWYPTWNKNALQELEKISKIRSIITQIKNS
jgi:hypothetical protein